VQIYLKEQILLQMGIREQNKGLSIDLISVVPKSVVTTCGT